jgi:hypothetical protein
MWVFWAIPMDECGRSLQPRERHLLLHRRSRGADMPTDRDAAQGPRVGESWPSPASSRPKRIGVFRRIIRSLRSSCDLRRFRRPLRRQRLDVRSFSVGGSLFRSSDVDDSGDFLVASNPQRALRTVTIGRPSREPRPSKAQSACRVQEIHAEGA